MGAPDPIVWDADAATWRYDVPAPAEGHDRIGVTVCCQRPLYVPEGACTPSTYPWPTAAPVILACCDTPGVPKPVELPPYSGEHTTCRKCGSKAVETEHRTSADSHSLMIPPGYPPEWLRRRCAVCQARWDEACITESDAPRDPLELVDLARVKVSPGDKLLVCPRDCTGIVSAAQAEEWAAHLRRDLAPHFPGVEILVLPLVAEVAVIEGGADD